MMRVRTTITLPDDLHRAVSAIAENAGLTFSETIARMVRDAVPGPGPIRMSISPVTGLPVFSGGRVVTAEDVRAMIAEDEDDEIGL